MWREYLWLLLFTHKYKTAVEKRKHAEILTIEQLFTYKIIKTKYFKYLTNVPEQTDDYNLRRRQRLIPLTFNKYGQRLTNVITTRIFNKLPARLKEFKKIGEVKREIKKYLINKQEWTNK